MVAILSIVAVVCLVTALMDMMMNGSRYAGWAPWGLGIAFAALLALISAGYSAELPDASKTPGEANPELTAEVICKSDFRTGPYRNVSASLKREVYASYHRKKVAKVCCEVDHLISLEIGGANTLRNLWPQRWKEARIKDQLENKLHKLVCGGDISLEDAQSEISSDWWKAYQKYVH